jgi:ATP-dependent RNA helicase TDRD9
MAQLPIDTRLGKLIVMGHAFGRIQEAIIIAAGLSVRNIFKQFWRSKYEFYKGKFDYTQGLLCDFDLIVSVYVMWKREEKIWMTQAMGNSRELKKMENDWAEKEMVDMKRLKELDKIVKEIENRLRELALPIGDSDLSDDNELARVYNFVKPMFKKIKKEF